MNREPRHQCLIYEGSPSLKLPALAAVIKQNIHKGYCCLYLNSPAMVAGMRSYLSAIDVHVADEIAKGTIILSSDAPAPGVAFDIDDMIAKLESTLDKALGEGYKGLFATGDMSWEFGPEKDFQKLLEYEWRLEELFQKRPELHGICQYHRDSMPHDAMQQGLLTHPAIFISDTLSRINPHYLSPTSPISQATVSQQKLDNTIDTLCKTQDVSS